MSREKNIYSKHDILDFIDICITKRERKSFTYKDINFKYCEIEDSIKDSRVETQRVNISGICCDVELDGKLSQEFTREVFCI